MAELEQLMTVEERRAFLKVNGYWLRDLAVGERGFFDWTESVAVSDADAKRILENRKLHNQPWRPNSR